MKKLLPLIITFCACITCNNALGKPAASDPYERLDAFAQVLHVIESNYVETIDRNKVIDGAISGMLRSLDPHSSFMSASQRKDFELRTGGAFVGIGVEVGVRGDELRVITAIAGGPADRAGISSGDVIVAVDGMDVTRMSLDELSMQLRGEPGSKVVVVVRHPGVIAPRQYTITREVVKTEITFSRLVGPHYGYVKLKSFGQGSAEKVRLEIEKLKKITNDDLRGLILDLRQNPGGFLNEASTLADMFLSSGTIVETRGRDGVSIQKYTASMSQPYKFPVAVLIDGGSASASEIVAGALQAHRRAIIVGVDSFGKASVQNMYTLKDGSSLKLTIGRYYTPDGRSIQAEGIKPDIYVEARTVVDTAEQKRYREKDLVNALANGSNDEIIKTQAAATAEDIQLGMAYSALYGLEIMGK